MSNSLVDYLKLVRADIPLQLISSENWSNIEAIAKIFPRAISDSFILESHLGLEAAKADFSICVEEKEVGSQILADDNYLIPLPEFLLENPIWSRIRNFSSSWVKYSSPFFGRVCNIRLECDVNGTHSNIPVPSFFFGLKSINSVLSTCSNQSNRVHPCQWISQVPLELLFDKNLSSKVECQLFKVFDLLPSHAYVFQIGAMLARNTETIRVCIKNISPEQILEYLVRIGWSGSISELEEVLTNLSTFVDAIALNIDVDEVIGPKIGLECSWFKQPQFEPRYQLFFDYLVETGLCIAQKRDALLGYPGYLSEQSDRELWPNSFSNLSSLLGLQHQQIITKKINHVKVVYHPEEPLQAKAYLSANHVFVPLKKDINRFFVDLNQSRLLQEAVIQILEATDRQKAVKRFLARYKYDFTPGEFWAEIRKRESQLSFQEFMSGIS